jgi:hypothetical protein
MDSAVIEILFIYQLARNPMQALRGAGGAAVSSAPRAANVDARNPLIRDVRVTICDT